MIEVGRVVLKIAGRDAGKLGVVLEVVDEKTILVDGAVRRRKVNVRHVEPLAQMVDVKKGASHADVIKALGLKEAKKGSKAKKEKSVKPAKVRKARDKSQDKVKASKEKK